MTFTLIAILTASTLGSICFFRYKSLYHSKIVHDLTKKIHFQKYDIGKAVKDLRSQRQASLKHPPIKNLQSGQTQTPDKNHIPKIPVNQPLPVMPVLADQALFGANTLYQYMCIDDALYDGVSKMAGEKIDNLSDLSAKLETYAHDSNGLTEGALTKLKGHVAESHIANHFKEAGAVVDWPEASNQEGWDLLVNGQHIQAKLYKDAGDLTEHFKEHSDIPVIINSDAENIPDTAFHFDPSDGMEGLTDYLSEHPENAVIVNESLSSAEVTEGVEADTDFALGETGGPSLPIVTIAFSGFREFQLLRKQETDLESAAKNAGLDVAGVAGGSFVGLKAGGVNWICYCPRSWDDNWRDGWKYCWKSFWTRRDK